MEPASDRERSLSYDRVVLHEIDHSDSGKYKCRAADDSYDQKSETLIADTRDDGSYRYTEEIRSALNVMDNPVTVILVSELACIDPVIPEKIDRHSEAETDRQCYYRSHIRDVDDTCNEGKEITCTRYEDKSNAAGEL